MDNDIENNDGMFVKIFKSSGIAILIAVALAALIVGPLIYFIPTISRILCAISGLYFWVIFVPTAIIVLGYILSIFGVGSPIVGLGVFMEIVLVMCDFLGQRSGWQIDVGLGVFSLIPIIGLLGNVGRIVRSFRI